MGSPRLRRNLSLPLVTLYGLGNILGAGIYVLIGKVAGLAGESTVLSFLVAMIIAGLTAFSYMELSNRYPKSASVSVYLHKAFDIHLLSKIIGLALVFGGIASAAALSKGFAGYLNQIVHVPEALFSVSLLLLLGLVAVKGIKESAKLAAAFTLVEALGLILIIWAGRSHITASEFISSLHIDPVVGLGGILLGAFLAFYAFIGFEDMVNVAEEVKKPKITMPLAILLSLAVATVLYLLVVLISISAVSPAQLAASEAPLSLVYSKVSHINPVYISLIGLSAAVNGIIVQIIMGSRILYGLSRQGWLHRNFSSINAESHTPVFATAAVVVAMMAGTLFLDLVSLARVTSFLILSVFVLVNLSLVVLKRRDGSAEASVKVPVAVPMLGAVCSLGMIAYEIVG